MQTLETDPSVSSPMQEIPAINRGMKCWYKPKFWVICAPEGTFKIF